MIKFDYAGNGYVLLCVRLGPCDCVQCVGITETWNLGMRTFANVLRV